MKLFEAWHLPQGHKQGALHSFIFHQRRFTKACKNSKSVQRAEACSSSA